jgi:hypothetical protein
MTMIPAAPSVALEKTAGVMPDDGRDDWRMSETCDVVYYNYCTGWIWFWRGWIPGDVLGIHFTACSTDPTLTTSWHHTIFGSPIGYGYTGTMEVYNADASGCPTGAPLGAQPLCPVGGWNGLDWDVPIPEEFALCFTEGPTAGNPNAWSTDHPAMGPTGPQACGYCYPVTRVSHSYYWGTRTSVVCPGQRFSDNICDAELIWDVTLSSPQEATPTSWALVKTLYR